MSISSSKNKYLEQFSKQNNRPRLQVFIRPTPAGLIAELL